MIVELGERHPRSTMLIARESLTAALAPIAPNWSRWSTRERVGNSRLGRTSYGTNRRWSGFG
jgi:hypothetical protein